MRYHTSVIAVCDVDPTSRRTVVGAVPTNNRAALQARISEASPTTPVTIVVDRHLATSTLIIPRAGFVTVLGDASGARIVAVPSANGHVFQSELAPQRPYDPGPPAPPIFGSHVRF